MIKYENNVLSKDIFFCVVDNIQLGMDYNKKYKALYLYRFYNYKNFLLIFLDDI